LIALWILLNIWILYDLESVFDDEEFFEDDTPLFFSGKPSEKRGGLPKKA